MDGVNPLYFQHFQSLTRLSAARVMAAVAMETDQSQWGVVFSLSQTLKFSASRSGEEHYSTDEPHSLEGPAEALWCFQMHKICVDSNIISVTKTVIIEVQVL